MTHYDTDVALVGGGLGGLSAAALLARRRVRSVVLGTSQPAGWSRGDRPRRRVLTSRHDPQAAQYGGTVTLRARSQGIDFTYAYPFSNRTSVLDAIDGATKSLLGELNSLSRACMDVQLVKKGMRSTRAIRTRKVWGTIYRANFQQGATRLMTRHFPAPV